MIRDWSNFIAGRTALVTGSGGGVGRAIAIQMARAGAELRINDIHLDRAEKVCREIEEEGGVATPVVADVSDRDQVARMVDDTGPCDILVNNAGIPAEGIVIKSFVETGPAEWDPLIRLNLAAVLGVTRAYLPAMISRAGAGSSRSSRTRAGAVSASRRSTAPRRRPRWASRAGSRRKWVATA